MLNFMKLELRKHRFLFRGIVGAFYATILFSALMSLANRVPTLQFMALTALSWAGPGLLLMPLLYGATSGAALRGEPAASAEAGLPISPGRKVGGALAAMGLYLLGVAVIFWTTAALLAPAIDGGGTRAGYAEFLGGIDRQGLGVLGLALAVFLLALIIMLLTSFTLAYQTKHAMLGGLVGGLLCGLLFTAVGGGIWLRTRLISGRWMREAPDWRNYLDVALIPLLGLLGTLAALRLLARWGERRAKPGLVGWGVIELGTLLGVAAAGLWMGVQYRAVSRSFTFVRPDAAWGDLDPAVADAAGRRAFFKTPDGALVSVDDRGERTLLLEGIQQHPLDLIKHLDEEFFVEARWDSDGTLWVLTRGTPFKDDGFYELWHGTPDARLKRHSYFKIDAQFESLWLARGPGASGLVAEKALERVFAPMPPPNKSPVFVPLSERTQPPEKMSENGQNFVFSWEAQRQLRLSDDRTSLIRETADGKRQSWIFPEGARSVHDAEHVDFHEFGGHRYLMLEVKLATGQRAEAVCDLDGTVRLIWHRPAGYRIMYSYEPAWVLLECREARDCRLLLRTETGEFLPPVLIDPAALTGEQHGLRNLQLIWSARSHIWLQYTDALFELDATTGKLIGKTKFASGFPGRIESVTGPGNQEGYPFITGNRLYRIGYDGTVKSLGRARLD